MSKGGRYLKKKVKKPFGKGKKIALIVLAVLLVAIVVAAVAGFGYVKSLLGLITPAEVIEQDVEMNEEMQAMMGNYETTEAIAPTEESSVATTEPTTVPTTLPYTPSNMDIINVLLIGQDAREGEASRLADTMILATVNKTTKTLTLTSIFRDTYVDMPNYMGHTCGWNRINVVYNLGYQWGSLGGAMEMMNMCLYDNFGIEVDYDVEVDFEAFKKAIDLLGGVDIDLTEAEADYLNKDDKVRQTVTPGVNTLTGRTALSYARMRKAAGDGDSDIKRTARQRNLIVSVIKKCTSMSFSQLQNIAEEVLPMIATNMTTDEITTCMWEILPILGDLKIESETCPYKYWGDIIDIVGVPSSVLKFNAQENKAYFRAITEGIIADTQ